MLVLAEQRARLVEQHFRELQSRLNLADVASRAIERAHAEAHTGAVETCETCAADRALVRESPGFTPPPA
ncbi:MAG: hypothetical protein JWQ19_3946 [Subtercola sp.]|nr:hypothetical protein [Subtercola sp.]